MDAITVKNLTVAYENHIVIKDLDLSIPRGKITAIIGANGCGKSTLLKTIARIIKPRRGEIFINGLDLRKQKEKFMATQVAFLPQGPICPGGITVRELVAFGRFPHQKITGGLKAHDKELIQWAIEETGLKEYADREVDTLSGGQRQRAWIAMTLAQETEIIMLDEPTTYLDLSYQLEVLHVLEKLNQQEKKTIVMVLHELNNACRFGHHIIGMKNGRIVCQGSPIEAITRANLRELFGIDGKLQLSEDGIYPICVDCKLVR